MIFFNKSDIIYLELTALWGKKMDQKIEKEKVDAYGMKFFIKKDGKEVARAFLYVMRNDIKNDIFGYLEDLHVSEELRGQGIGTLLVNTVINEAKKIGCYKLDLVCQLENKGAQELYKKMGFENLGLEFKMYFKKH